MLQTPRQLACLGLVPFLEIVIERMADGRPITFASRYGFSQSGIKSRELDRGNLRSQRRAMLLQPEAVSVHPANKRSSLDRKKL